MLHFVAYGISLLAGEAKCSHMEDHGRMAEPGQATSSKHTVPVVVDAAVGAAAMAMGAAVLVTRQFARAAAPVWRVVVHPPLLHERLHPARVVEALADRGHEALTSTDGELNRVVAAVVPPVVYEVLDSLDLTAIIDRVDIDAILRQVDIDALVRQVDVDAIVERIDIDAIARRIDVDAIVERIDIDAIVSRVDIDAIARRIDLDAIVERIDIDAIVSRVDVDAIVQRLDLVALAEEVVNGIDLPEIIRESTGSMASEVVRDARMQSIDADVAIARLIDRVLRRRRPRSTDAPGEPESLTRADLAESTDVAPTPSVLSGQPEPPKQELRR
jgi:hypothetical protein